MEILIVLGMGAAAVAAVLYPVVAGGRAGAASAVGVPSHLADDAAIDAEVARYREALRAGSVCPHCAFPNPGGSRFCAGCGRGLDAGAAAAR